VRTGRAADHSPPSSAAVMEEYSYTSTHPLGHTGPVTGSLYFFLIRCLWAQWVKPGDMHRRPLPKYATVNCVSQRKVYERVETFKFGRTSESVETPGSLQKIKFMDCPPCKKKSFSPYYGI